MQNHMMQMLCSALIDSPAEGATSAQRRVDVLRAIRAVSPDEAVRISRRARYTAGRLADGRGVPDYADESGVDPSRNTETFAEVKLTMDSREWRGVPIVLRAAKAIRVRRRGVLVHPSTGADPIWTDLDTPGSEAAAEVGAYRAVLGDLLSGGSRYSVRGDEAELAWAIFDPVLAVWAEGRVPMETYPAGSDGPGAIQV